MFPFEWLPCVIDSACVCHHWVYLRSWGVGLGTSPRLAKFRLWSVITLTLLSQESQRSSALRVRADPETWRSRLVAVTLVGGTGLSVLLSSRLGSMARNSVALELQPARQQRIFEP
jgi:hypothetical protein